MAFPLGETAVSAAVGLVDGAVSATDAKAGRVEATKQHATWAMGGLLLIGGLLEMANVRAVKPALKEPLITAPAALLARRLAFAQVVKGAATPVPAYGMVAAPRLPVSAPAGHIAAPASAMRAPFLKQATAPAI